MKNVSVIGHFGFGKRLLNGQTIKTEIITGELEKRLGENEVYRIDTHGGKLSSLLKAPFQARRALKMAKNVLIFPAHNGLRIFAPLLVFWKNFFKNRKLHYVVIGGWLPSFLIGRKELTEKLKKFDAIYVETNTAKIALENQGFKNIVVMPNCKNLQTLNATELVYSESVPLRLCIFSRVMPEKGIETAVNVIREINARAERAVFSLDIYGQISEGYESWFDNLQKNFPIGVSYKGFTDSDKSVTILRNYFALLFPTHFYTEGVPGTVIDAYAAGVPVISAKWESFSDIIEDGKTGVGYAFDNIEEMKKTLLIIASNPKKILDMKENCIKKAETYRPESALKVLFENLA